MNYIVVDHADIRSPVEEGLYEYVNGSYVLSADEGIDADKTYYMLDDDVDDEPEYIEADVEVGDDVSGLYEYDGESEYFPTSDVVAQAGKTYYELYDTTGQYVPDVEGNFYYPIEAEVDNPVLENLYEFVDGEYVLTQDILYDDSKTYYRRLDPAMTDTVEDLDEDPVYSLDDVVPTGVAEDTAEIPSSEDFIFAYTEFVTDPSAEGFYEIVNDAYVLTQDTEVIEGKDYYEFYHYSDYYEADMTHVSNPSLSLDNYYEIVGGSYVLTSDTAVVSGKTYYRSHTEDLYPFRADPITSLIASGIDVNP